MRNLLVLVFFFAVLLPGCKPAPEPTPSTKLGYSRAVRLDYTSVADVWRLHLDSKVIGACAVSYSGEVLIPLRVWGESQGKRVDWDNEKRAVVVGDRRVYSPVVLILQTAYTTPENLQNYSGLRHEVIADYQTVIIHTCAGEGLKKGGC